MKREVILSGFVGLALGIASAANGEVRIGNGGDAMAAQFVETGDDIVQLVETAMKAGNMTLPAEVDFATLKRKIQSAVVSSQERTFLADGTTEVDALNFPRENRIMFSRSRMKSLVFNLKAQRTLVAHEYLWLAGVDDSSYKYSIYIVRKLMNGGDEGELWLLRDLAMPGFQNPFRTPALEFSAQVFIGSGAVTRYFQEGKALDEHDISKSRPYCVLTTNSAGSSTGTVKSVRIGISAAQPVAGSNNSRVELKLARPTLSPYLECASGEANRKVTLGDMLDSLGTAATFSHEGSSPLGNVICK